MQYSLGAEYPRWELPLSLPAGTVLETTVAAFQDVEVVVPVKDDTAGVAETLGAFLDMAICDRPWKVIVVDDRLSDDGRGTAAAVETATARGLDAEALLLPANIGPAAARNAGAGRTASSWIWFVDAGVRPVPGFLPSLVQIGSVTPAVAWTGPLIAADTGPYAAYYAKCATLCPPADADGELQGTVTASVVVAHRAFIGIGGFDARFRLAACEDFDIGLRLRAHGRIGWDRGLTAQHRYAEDEADFRKRFGRYGYGFYQFGQK
jgi:GT2 family glycosyltransferase